MSFIDVVLSKEKDASNQILSATTATTTTSLISKVLNGVSQLNSYREAFKCEFKMGSNWNHPHILP